MIEQRTVLILGAGASRDFGFPLGAGLKREICDLLRRGEQSICAPLEANGFDSDQRMQLAEALRQSGAPSIDAFLADRLDLVPIGKMAIAAALIPYEAPQAVHALREAPFWLDVVFDRMRAPKSEWHKNQLSIVTFNYDRLVEQYFHVALMNRFNLKPAEAVDLLRRTVRIFHVHGLLDDFSYALDVPGRMYSSHVTSEIVRKAAAKIRIVHEGGEEDDVFVEARQMLQMAGRIVVMGFGYDPTNVSRLGFASLTPNKLVVGSAFNLKTHERTVAQKLARPHPLTLANETETLTDVLRAYESVGN